MGRRDINFFNDCIGELNDNADGILQIPKVTVDNTGKADICDAKIQQKLF